MHILHRPAPAPGYQVQHSLRSAQEGLSRVCRALLVDWVQGKRQAIMGTPTIRLGGLAITAS